MGLFGVGGIGFNRERTQVQDAMDVIGGCRKHQIKVLADRVCDQGERKTTWRISKTRNGQNQFPKNKKGHKGKMHLKG